MPIEIDLSVFNNEKNAELVASVVKDALIKKEAVLIAIDGKDGTSIIPNGTAADVLTLMVLEFINVIRFYKIADVDGILECFVKNVKSNL